MTLLQKSMHIKRCTMTMLRKSKYTIHSPVYERMECFPRISDREQARRRKAVKPTSALAKHSPKCPGLNEKVILGSCTSNRHILTAPANTEDKHPNRTMAIQNRTLHRTKAAFTDAQVVSTATANGHG